ncbi:MAG: hypothetical protein Q4C61_00735 [Lachnospiraceae bacterium]|nr:hypothetical protein [Lachnospiraceae bacterium]
MSDLFYTGSSKRTGGVINVSYSGAPDIVKKLKKLENGGEVAIKRTVSDFTSRAPGWVSKGIRAHYGVDTAAIKDAATKPKRGRTSIRVAGITVDGATMEYKGRTLTPTHFKMSPKTKNPKGLTTKKGSKIPGQAVHFKKGPPGQVAMSRAPNPYTVKATIIKGQRVSLGGGTFIAQSTKDGQQVPLPFQKTGEGRTPIEAVRTLSVPQMIDGRARDTIEQTISEKLGERFQHHVAQAMK